MPSRDEGLGDLSLEVQIIGNNNTLTSSLVYTSKLSARNIRGVLTKVLIRIWLRPIAQVF